MGLFKWLSKGSREDRAAAELAEVAQQRLERERARLARLIALAGGDSSSIDPANLATVDAVRAERLRIAQLDPLSAARECLAESEVLAGEIEDPTLRFFTLLRAGASSGRIGDAESCARGFGEAAELVGDLGRDFAWLERALSEVRVRVKDDRERAARTQLFESIAGAMRENPDPIEGDAMLHDLAIARADCGDFEGALELAETLADEESAPDVLAAIVESQCAQDDIEGARATLARIEDPRSRSAASKSIATALAKHDRTAEALEMLPQIRSAMDRSLVGTEVAASHARAGNLDAANEALAAIEDPMQRANALSAVAGALMDTGRVEQAREVVDQIEQPGAREESLGELVTALLRARNLEGAREVAAAIEDPWYRAGAFRRIATSREIEISGEERAGLMSEVADLAARSSTGARLASDPRWIATLLIESGDLERATELAATVRDAEQRRDVLETVAAALASHERGDRIEDLLARAADPYERGTALLGAAQGWLQLHVQRARKTGADADEV